jgi:3-dehydroquinate synthase/shikimate kinase/3-dehydroquinate synthase
MKTINLKVNTGGNRYSILIGTNLIQKFDRILQENSIKFNKCLLIIDKNIPQKQILILKKVLNKKKIFFVTINANEKNKNQNTINTILNILLKKNFSRQDCLIAMGGGITGDITGFAASVFKRGMKFINIPTTLLSQVDSSIGGKTGINTVHGKNLIGSFYQPELVISDKNFLKSLPRREIICGYAEILKHSLISNKKFYKFLSKNIFKILNLETPFIEKAIFESCKIKKLVIEKDEKEKSLRKVLNFGHTFAHAYEATLGYSKKLNHGEAVLLGISTALKFSQKNNIFSQKDYKDILAHMKVSSLPCDIKKYFSSKNLNQIISFMLKDKKNNSDDINLILLKKIGYPIINKKFKKNKLKIFLQKELVN